MLKTGLERTTSSTLRSHRRVRKMILFYFIRHPMNYSIKDKNLIILSLNHELRNIRGHHMNQTTLKELLDDGNSQGIPLMEVTNT